MPHVMVEIFEQSLCLSWEEILHATADNGTR